MGFLMGWEGEELLTLPFPQAAPSERLLGGNLYFRASLGQRPFPIWLNTCLPLMPPCPPYLPALPSIPFLIIPHTFLLQISSPFLPTG